MEFYNTETFVNHDKSRMFTFWEDDYNDLMMSWVCRATINTEIPSVGVKQVSLKDLKRIFELCSETSDETPRYSLVEINEDKFYIKINSPGESRSIVFRKCCRGIEIEFCTSGLYLDKSDPEHWVERDYVLEVGDEHKLTCKDLYRIRKMCNISDIE